MSATNIAALFVILFIYGWTQYLWPLLVTNSNSMNTIVIALRKMISFADADAPGAWSWSPACSPSCTDHQIVFFFFVCTSFSVLLVTELQELHRRYRMDEVFFLDDDLFAEPERIQSLASDFIHAKIQFKWKGTARADELRRLPEGFFDVLRESAANE